MSDVKLKLKSANAKSQLKLKIVFGLTIYTTCFASIFYIYCINIGTYDKTYTYI